MPTASDEELARYYREHAQAFTREGRVVAFEDARADVARALAAQRKNALVADWLAGLRRRADIIDLYLPVR